MKWTIYCHIHVESGRRYVGLTKTTMLQRWNKHVYLANRVNGEKFYVTSHFPNAIRKYGKNAFMHEVLEICDTLEAGNAAEIKWIKFYDTTNPEKGFNLSKGGNNTPHPIRKNPWNDPEYRKKCTDAARIMWNDPEYRKKCTDAARITFSNPEVIAKSKAARETEEYKIRKACINREILSRPDVKVKLVGFTGKHHSPETKAKFAVTTAKFWTGKKLSSKTKAKISSSITKRGYILNAETTEIIRQKNKLIAQQKKLERSEQMKLMTHKLCKHHGLIPISECKLIKYKSGGSHYACRKCCASASLRCYYNKRNNNTKY